MVNMTQPIPKTDNIPKTVNLIIAAGFVLLTAYSFLLLPLLLLPASPWWLLTLVPAAFSANTLWYFTHEAFHMNMHPNRQWNDAMGRVMAVCFGAPYDLVRFGHLQHHRFNGALFDRAELYDPEQTSRRKAAISYYWNIFGGLYVQEFLTYFVFFAGRRVVIFFVRKLLDSADEKQNALRELALKQLATDAAVRRARMEGAAFFALLFLGLWAYGPYWPALLGFLAARGFLVSFANNLPHYDTPASDVRYGLNVQLSAPLSWFYLHFNHHRQHHHSPTTPWLHLPRTFRENEDVFETRLAPAALAQLRGPVSVDKVS